MRILTQNLGWRSIFLSILPFCLIIIVLIFWKLKSEWAEAKGEKFDFIGFIIYSFTLIAVRYGFSLLPARQGMLLLLIGIIGIFALIKYEMTAEAPVLDIALFRNNKVFALSNLAALINYSATSTVSFLLSLHLQYIKALTPQNAGLMLLPQPIVMASFSPLAGRLSDRVEPRFYGMASGTLGTMRLIGQMLSMGIAMLIFAIYIGRAQITPEYYSLFLKSAKTAFTIFAALCFAGIFASLAWGK